LPESDGPSCAELASAALEDRSQALRWAVARLPLAGDQEAVHDTRVALRRLREAVAALSACLRPRERGRETRLRSAERALGALRDAEARYELLSSVLGPVAVSWDRRDDPRAAAEYGSSILPGSSGPEAGLRGLEAKARGWLADTIAAEMTAERESLLGGRALPRLGRLADGFEVLANRPGREPARAVAAQQLPRLFERAAVAPRSERELHRRRIRTRRLRYRLELFGPALPEEHRRVVEELRRLQSMLGRFHDLAILVEWMDGTSRRGRHDLRPALRRLTVRVELEHQAAREVAEEELRRLDGSGWWDAAQRACLG
jgi:CHAD domain-containing protein